MLADYFGTAAGILTSIRLVPQVYKSIRTLHTRDLSTSFLVIILFQALFLILYGFTKPDLYILYSNVIPLVCSIILVYLKYKFKDR